MGVVGLEEAETPTVGSKVPAERAAEVLGRSFPRRYLQQACKGEGDRRQCSAFYGSVRRSAFQLAGKMDHWLKTEVGELEVSERVYAAEVGEEGEKVAQLSLLVVGDGERDSCST